MAHKEIFELINKNLSGLSSIDNIIDEDIHKEILKFLPENNWELRNKLYTISGSIPIRENKFTNLLNEFVESKENEITRKMYLTGIYIIF